MSDLTVKYKKPRSNRTICIMCGEKPENGKLVVIMDPNKFPANEEEDTWDVCERCRDFVNKGTSMSLEIMTKSLLGEEIDNDAIREKYGFTTEKPAQESLAKEKTIENGE